MADHHTTPFLIPMEPDEFWLRVRAIIREELNSRGSRISSPLTETPGLTEKPLYKMQEVCALFNISKPTVYEWIRSGKLQRLKIHSRVYFPGSNIRALIQAGQDT